MHRSILELLTRSCISVAASVVLISSAGVTPTTAAEGYTPTVKDMLSIQGAIERYLKGMDTRDVKLEETAFWDDAVIISPQSPQGPPVKMSFRQILAPLQMPPQGGASGPNQLGMARLAAASSVSALANAASMVKNAGPGLPGVYRYYFFPAQRTS